MPEKTNSPINAAALGLVMGPGALASARAEATVATTPDEKPFAVTAAELRGDPDFKTIGPLRLRFQPLKMGAFRTELKPALGLIPSIFIEAASLPGDGEPDIELLAHYLNQRADLAGLDDRVDAPMIRAQLVALATSPETWLASLCGALWLVIAGTTGIVWPYPDLPKLPESPTAQQIQEHHDQVQQLLIAPTGTQWLDDVLIYAADQMEIWEACCFYVDLVRAIIRCHGQFTDSPADRFT